MHRALTRLTVVAVCVALAVTGAASASPVASAHGIRIGPLSHRTVSGRPTGIDVSIYQHPHHARIHWRVVARHHRFVFVEATGGAAGWRSPYYHSDVRHARRAGMAVGAYAFADLRRPVRATARRDARHFAHVVGRQTRPGTLPPVLDVELNHHHLSGPEIVTWVRTWALTVKKRTGRKPIVYTYPFFWSHKPHAAHRLSKSFKLWIAYYTRGHGRHPMLPRKWHHWTFWQAAGGNGRSAGVRGEVDLNVFNGSLRQLNRLALRGHHHPRAQHHHPRTQHHRAKHRHHAKAHHHHAKAHHHHAKAHHHHGSALHRRMKRHRGARHHHHAVKHLAMSASTPVVPRSVVNAMVGAITGLATAGTYPSGGGLYNLLTAALQATLSNLAPGAPRPLLPPQ